MRILTPLLLLLSLAACNNTKSAESSPPPPEMVGVFTEAVPASQSSGPQDVCSGVTVGAGSVSTSLFKIDEFGNVFDGKEITDSNNPYRIIGTMDATGKLTPNVEGRREFLGNFADVSGVTMNPLIVGTFGFDPIKGQYIKLTIELQIITQGQTVTQPWEERDYFKITAGTESSFITKAQQCLAKTKP